MKGKAWFVPLVAGVCVSTACGGGTTNDAPSTGGVAATGGSSTGGNPPASGGTTPSSGATSSSGGAQASGGTTGSGGHTSSGGSGGTVNGGSGGTSSGGSGGSLPAGCDCEAPSVWVCGVDGQTYDAGCGSECVPAEIDCSGQCPCDPEAGCGCVAEGGSNPQCEAQDGLVYVCEGTDWIGSTATDLCEDIPTGAVRYCCPLSVPGDAFCPE
jgi:hypothetical protein